MLIGLWIHVVLSFVAPTAKGWDWEAFLVLRLVCHGLSGYPWRIVGWSCLVLSRFPLSTQIIIILVFFIVVKRLHVEISCLVLVNFLDCIVVSLLKQGIDFGDWLWVILVTVPYLRLVSSVLAVGVVLLGLGHWSAWLCLGFWLRVHHILQVVEWIGSLSAVILVWTLSHFGSVPSFGRIKTIGGLLSVVNGGIVLISFRWRLQTITKVEIKLAVRLALLTLGRLYLTLVLDILSCVTNMLRGIQSRGSCRFYLFLHNAYYKFKFIIKIFKILNSNF